MKIKSSTIAILSLSAIGGVLSGITTFRALNNANRRCGCSDIKDIPDEEVFGEEGVLDLDD